MRDVASRIADLSGERRKALEALLKSAPVPAPNSEDTESGNGTEPGSAAADWLSIDANDYYGPAPDAATAKARTFRF